MILTGKALIAFKEWAEKEHKGIIIPNSGEDLYFSDVLSYAENSYGFEHRYCERLINGFIMNWLQDEIRISSGTAFNSDWMLADYNSQHSPSTFVTIGAEQTTAPPTLPIQSGLTISGGELRIIGGKSSVP